MRISSGSNGGWRLVRAAVLAGSLAGFGLVTAPALAFHEGNPDAGEGLDVDKQGIYLFQRQSQCAAGGPCDLQGQCPGGEYASGRYPYGPWRCGPGPYRRRGPY